MEDAAAILEALPHRHPFLMVDRVLELVPGKRAVALKNITNDFPFQRGCGGVSYPELFLLEAMAQVGALAAADASGGGLEGRPGYEPGYLAGLHDVRFNKRPSAGDQVVFTLNFEASMGGLVRFKGTAKIGEEVAAESSLTFSAPKRL